MGARWLAAVGLACLVGGCPGGDGPAPTPTPAPPGRIILEPASVDFGQVFVGEHPSVGVVIRNAGGRQLVLELPQLGAPFEHLNPEDFEPALEPEEVTLLEVRFAPAADGYLEQLVPIASGSPGVTNRTLRLAGTGLGPELVISPAEHDFGSLELGCDAGVEVELRNLGGAPLEVLDLSFEHEGEAEEMFLLDPNPHDGDPGTIDFVLVPQESTTVDVLYVPLDVEPDVGLLRVRTYAWPEEGVGTASFTGHAHHGDPRVDTWVQEVPQGVDLLLVIDDTPSMADEQAWLATNLATWFEAVRAELDDWQLAVTTTDAGAAGELQGAVPILDPTTPDLTAEFTASTSVGTGGAEPSAGLHAAWAALQAAANGQGDHAGLLRPDAALHLVFVSDGREESISVMGWDWTWYVDSYWSLEASPDMVSISSVTGGLSGCSGPAGDALDGAYWVLPSQVTGGQALSICDADWGDELASGVAWMYEGVDAFELSQRPVVATIEVMVQGAVVSDWTYEPTPNRVVFEPGHVPAHGDLVEISYSPMGDCTD